MKQDKIVIYYLLISTIFLLLLILVNSYTHLNYANDNERKIIAIIFLFILILGLSFSFYPNWHKRYINKKIKNMSKNKINNKKINRIGHHPNCQNFKTHIIKIKKRDYCTGCLGLGIGSIISILILIFYLILLNNQSILIYQYIVYLGIIFIYLSFLDSLILKKFKIIHILSNILLIIGFQLIILGTFEVTGKLIFGFVSILASFLFLETRIQISILNHQTICKNCMKECKMY